MPVTVKIDFAKMIAIQRKLRHIPGATDKAIKRAAKRTSGHGFTQISKQITKFSNIKAAITKDKMSKGASGKNGAFVRLKKTGRLGVRHFKPKYDETGVKYQIGKKDKILFVAKAFSGPPITVDYSPDKIDIRKKRKRNVRQYIKWKGNAAVRVGKSRLPIVFVKGVSPAGFFSKRKMLQPTQTELQRFFYKRLQHEVDFILKQKRGT